MVDEINSKMRVRTPNPNTLAYKIILVLSRPEPKTFAYVVEEVKKLASEDEKIIKTRVRLAISLFNIYSRYDFDKENLIVKRR